MPSPEGKVPGSPEPREGKCGARLKGHNDPLDPRFGRYCDQPEGFGTSHVGRGACKFHGGSVPSHLVKAARQEVQEEATRLQQELGEPASLRDPAVELWDLTAKIVQWSQIAERKMAELDEMDPSVDRAGIEHTREVIAMWERAIERSRDTLLSMMKLDLRRRVVELQEEQGALIGAVILSVIENAQLGLTDDQIEIGRRLLGEKLSPLLPQLKPAGVPDIDFIDAKVLELEQVRVAPK